MGREKYGQLVENHELALKKQFFRSWVDEKLPLAKKGQYLKRRTLHMNKKLWMMMDGGREAICHLLVFCRDVLGAESWLPVLLVVYFLSAIAAVVFYKRFAVRFGLLRVWRGAVLLSIIAFAPVSLLGDGDDCACCIAAAPPPAALPKFSCQMRKSSPSTSPSRSKSAHAQAPATLFSVLVGSWRPALNCKMVDSAFRSHPTRTQWRCVP